MLKEIRRNAFFFFFINVRLLARSSSPSPVAHLLLLDSPAFSSSHLQNTSSILYQRGVYPPESFQQKKQYGLSLTVTSDDKLAAYLATVLEHLERWLAAGALKRLVLVIAGSPEGDVLERWTFDVQTDAKVVAGEG